ncbi:Tex family protein [Anaerolineales bacterium HSG6]|nr:Tex family protein [Anaerolineales bacterium HSG6]MDM8531586.1 Tex family protein [Anaerolineales bacterium HSG25]
MTTNYAQKIAAELSLSPQQVAAAIDLFNEGNTMPFIARYRKEVTGQLDEEQLRQIEALLEKWTALDARRATIIASVESQGLMTPELMAQFMAAETMTELEDLYQPYKPKRRTRASIAREKGLTGLADILLAQPRTDKSFAELAADYLSEEVPTVEEAFAGARDIVAETISDHPKVRRATRERAMKWSNLECGKIKKAEDPKEVYKTYYEFDFRVNRLRPHQILALNRGETEKVLRVKVPVSEQDWQRAVTDVFQSNPSSPLVEQMKLAMADGANRLLLPAIERDVRRALTEKAENHAIRVFADNLRNLLTQPPLVGHTVLGIDPGFRTGCKVTTLDPTGKLVDTGTFYLHQETRALTLLAEMVNRHGVTLIAVGNGTGSRETEQLVAELTKRLNKHKKRSNTKYLIVNEAGASVYSASKLARAELPDLDVSVRGAVSIARRVQDPLAELVKIDPKSIGVGMYQHDVDQKALNSTLDGVVESVVNHVGVDVNTASPALLTHVAGIGPKLAERIVTYRDEHGPFKTRTAVKKVSGLGPKAFEQSAGFLRIREGDNPLDASAIHPESYGVAKAVLKQAGLTVKTPLEKRARVLKTWQAEQSLPKLAQELNTGVPTLTDIINQLQRPGRDPREDLPPPILRSDVLTMEDLMVGMTLNGTVRNVVDFGAFVDIGVKQDGLLHRSKIPFGTVLGVGDVLEVEILKIEAERGRISLGWVK